MTLPLASTFKTSKGSVSQRTGFLVRVEVDGVVGWGEASPFPGLSRETMDTVQTELAGIHHQSVDLPTGLKGVHALVYKWVSSPSAAHGFGTALLDCMAQIAGVPLSRFLNKNVRREVPISHLYTDSDALFHAVMLGTQTVKIKVGMGSVQHDIERIRQIRDIAGPDIQLRLDANGAWSEDDASHMISNIQEFNVCCIEDPVHAENLDAMARLRGRGIDIAADEALYSPTALQEVIDRQAADVVVVKPMRVGTPLTALAMIALANDAGLDSFVTTTMDSAVGRMTALHIAAAAPTSGLRACGLNTGQWLDSDVAKMPDMTGSHINGPEQPGLGLTVSP